jgi:hypothetical protein
VVSPQQKQAKEKPFQSPLVNLLTKDAYILGNAIELVAIEYI